MSGAVLSGLMLMLASWLAPVQPSRAQDRQADNITIRVGYFPNVTHVQALVARNFERHGRNWFAEHLGSNVKIEWYAYNAGPGAMRAILAKSLDLSYVGPSSVIAAYALARGADIRIVAGALTGGSALVVQPNSKLAKPTDFRGKRMATPELGNTQDVSARAWLAAGGVRISPTGGEVEIAPTPNPDQLGLFTLQHLDAVWTVEPWVSRLELLADGKILVEEKDASTTVLVSSAAFLSSQRDMARRFVAAHRELSDWIKANPAEAQRMITDELLPSFQTRMSKALLAQAWGRIRVTDEVSLPWLRIFVERARQAGFFPSAPDLSRLVETP